MSEAVQAQASGFVDVRPNPASVAPRPRRGKFRVGRAIKVTLAVTLLCGTATIVLLNQNHVTTDNAVVSAYVLSVRSPIQGQVQGLQLRVGDTLAEDSALARVRDDRVSEQHLVELRTELARERVELAGLEVQRNVLQAIRGKLALQAQHYRAAQMAYTAASATESKAQVLSSEARVDLARRTMARKLTLGRTGDAPLASVEQATLEARAAEADLSAQSAHVAALSTREAAAAQGVFLDAGSNDVSYSAQRIDDIDLRLADIGRSEAVLEGARNSAQARLEAEERHYESLARADLVSPNRGMVWKLGASNGERVGAGETIAQVVDCEASFIVASIPQRDFSSVEVGALARFRLSGEAMDREGRVTSVTGDANVTGDRNLAAAPMAERGASGIVRIEVPRSGNNGAACLVGRTARVLLPVAGGGLIDRALRLLKWPV